MKFQYRKYLEDPAAHATDPKTGKPLCLTTKSYYSASKGLGYHDYYHVSAIPEGVRFCKTCQGILNKQKEQAMCTTSDKFWMVMASRPGSSTSVIHTTKDLAWKEMERLARANAGVTFYVLETITKAVVSNLVVTNL